MCSLVEWPCTFCSTLQEDGYHRVATDLRNKGGAEWTFEGEDGVIQALCLAHVDDFMLACSGSPLGKRIFDGNNNLYEWRRGSLACSHSCAHESHKPTTNTPKHGADLRFVSQNTRKKSHSSSCHHIDDETENPKSRNLSCPSVEP